MKEKKELIVLIDTVHKRVLHYEPPGSGIGMSEAEGGMKGSVSMNFDYEKGNKCYYLHIDTSIGLPSKGHIMVRSVFKLNYGKALRVLFVPGLLEPAVRGAWDICAEAMQQRCQANGISFDKPLKISDEIIRKHAASMKEQYFKSRRMDDAANKHLLMKTFLTFTIGTKTVLLLRATVMILEEVLVINPAFDCTHNSSVFPVPIPIYHTVKLKCIKEGKEKITMNFYYGRYFLIMLDCALNLLSGEHARLLAPALQEKGMTKLKEAEFIVEANKYFAMLHAFFKKSNIRITELSNPPDWAKLIRTRNENRVSEVDAKEITGG
jgi:hypothetical protein